MTNVNTQQYNPLKINSVRFYDWSATRSVYRHPADAVAPLEKVSRPISRGNAVDIQAQSAGSFPSRAVNKATLERLSSFYNPSVKLLQSIQNAGQHRQERWRKATTKTVGERHLESARQRLRHDRRRSITHPASQNSSQEKQENNTETIPSSSSHSMQSSARSASRIHREPSCDPTTSCSKLDVDASDAKDASPTYDSLVELLSNMNSNDEGTLNTCFTPETCLYYTHPGIKFDSMNACQSPYNPDLIRPSTHYRIMRSSALSPRLISSTCSTPGLPTQVNFGSGFSSPQICPLHAAKNAKQQLQMLEKNRHHESSSNPAPSRRSSLIVSMDRKDSLPPAPTTTKTSVEIYIPRELPTEDET